MHQDYGEVSVNAEKVCVTHPLHLMHDPMKILKDCYDALNPGGSVQISYRAGEDMKNSPEDFFFPGARELDEEHVKTTQQVEEMLREIGFSQVQSSHSRQQNYSTPEDRLEVVMKNPNPTLKLLRKQNHHAYEAGVFLMETYIEQFGMNGHPHLLEDTVTVTVGRK